MNSSSELSEEKTVSNKIESKDIFKNLKNDYFLQNLFCYLLKKKTLEIIKYNNIYFNDNKEEIKRNDLNENYNVSKIKIIIDYQVK